VSNSVNEDSDLGAALVSIRRKAKISLATLETELKARGRVVGRQRLSSAEAGRADLDWELWQELAIVLEALGANPSDVADFERIVAVRGAPESGALGMDRMHHMQRWLLMASLPSTRIWPILSQLVEPLGIALPGIHAEIMRRLELGITNPGTWLADSRDSVSVDANESAHHVRVARSTPFVASMQLRNTGEARWEDRLLVRLGPPVASSLPYTLGVLPVPNSQPGESCDIVVPGRSHWFPNLAVVSYVMAFPDFTICVPGRVEIAIDTRDADDPDQTFRFQGV